MSVDREAIRNIIGRWEVETRLQPFPIELCDTPEIRALLEKVQAGWDELDRLLAEEDE